MTVASILLTDQNNAISSPLVLNYLPGFVDYFKELTNNSAIIFSQNAFENTGHILKAKKNIVISPNEKYHSDKAKTYRTVEQALDKCKKETKVFLVGVEILAQSAPFISEIYRTCVKARFKSDSFYPEIDTNKFDLDFSACVNADENNKVDYCIERWVRAK
jgi:dihydrofolate reductase